MLLFIEFEFMFFRSFKNFVSCFFNMSQFRFVNSLYVNILMSFTKFVTLKRNLTFLHIFNKFAL